MHITRENIGISLQASQSAPALYWNLTLIPTHLWDRVFRPFQENIRQFDSMEVPVFLQSNQKLVVFQQESSRPG